MAKGKQVSKREAQQQLFNHIAAQIKAGKSRSEIASGLEQSGFERSDAERAVVAVHQGLVKSAEQEQLEQDTLLKAVIGAGLAAVVGGVVWGAIVVITDYELGIIATGIGALAGFVVITLTDKRGRALQVISVAGAMVGILIGKYVAVFAALRQFATEEYGAEVARQISPFSADVVQFFVEVLPEIASPYDILWIVLAVVAAWRIPRGLGWQPPKLLG